MKHTHRKRGNVNSKRISFKMLAISIIIIFGLVIFSLYVNSHSRIWLKGMINAGSASAKGDVIECIDFGIDKDFFTKDSAQLKYNTGSSDIFGDYCKDTVNLIEYSCKGNGLASEEYHCSSGCYDGACVNPQNVPTIFNNSLSSRCEDFNYISPVNAVARSQYGGYSALYAIDQDPSTHWFGRPTLPFPEWIYFDLGETKCVSSADMYFFKEDLPLIIEIQGSHDTVIWRDLWNHKVTINNSINLNMEFPKNLTVRYIRLVEFSSKRPYGTISEIRLNAADIKP